MTLEQWTESNNIRAMPYNKEGYDSLMTVVDRNYLNRADLWHLSDYVVTGVTGGTIWLAKRRENR